jgi:cytosine/adenosine deaminase-related metal-dependent hydrolase
LLANTPIGTDWGAIHATHMTAQETAALANSGAVAGLCPITEANLGDGPFNGPGWLAAGGAFGIGSDSNVRISLTEELRTLEYSQRLRDIARNVMVEKKTARSVSASMSARHWAGLRLWGANRGRSRQAFWPI